MPGPCAWPQPMPASQWRCSAVSTPLAVTLELQAARHLARSAEAMAAARAVAGSEATNARPRLRPRTGSAAQLRQRHRADAEVVDGHRHAQGPQPRHRLAQRLRVVTERRFTDVERQTRQPVATARTPARPRPPPPRAAAAGSPGRAPPRAACRPSAPSRAAPAIASCKAQRTIRPHQPSLLGHDRETLGRQPAAIGGAASGSVPAPAAGAPSSATRGCSIKANSLRCSAAGQLPLEHQRGIGMRGHLGFEEAARCRGHRPWPRTSRCRRS